MPEFIPEQSEDGSGVKRIATIIPSRQLQVSDPLKWMAYAWFDFTRAPVVSLLFGLFFLVMPWVTIALFNVIGWHLVLVPAIVSFMLIGPYLAGGLYDISYQLHKGNHPAFRHCLAIIKQFAFQAWRFGILLMLIMLVWMRIASLLHQLYEDNATHSLVNSLPFMVIGALIGLAFALLVFCISVFTQPLLIERRVDMLTAVLTSMNCVWQNKYVMLIWASIIVLLVSVSFFTGFVAFTVVMPLLGFASWHGYRDAIITRQ
ncbi:DUF2189 domain-containing protein [Neptunicella marina]|uniref:DUF2189 domain-containing protein n=1 Tax=Neptunicella marina TaxID=2125989 RepID=A0A8J6M053_9ALTE|nr:DUF2189 domain-containing protein [Neptunicella marina]MBC3764258.1 DUF2189 domain-containing protein [Neptunicella marina]